MMQGLGLLARPLPNLSSFPHSRVFSSLSHVNTEPKSQTQITEPKSQNPPPDLLKKLYKYCPQITEPKSRVGISSLWYEGHPCNLHLLHLANAVQEGLQRAGMVGCRFDTIGFNNAISLGTRDLIADRIETIMGGRKYDANITIACDKNIAGRIMAIGRINRPSIMVYGGTKKVYGYISSGDLRKYIIQTSCPGAGTCGGMYTANTMAYAIEVMGMSLPYSSSRPAERPFKLGECHFVGTHLRELIELDLKPRDIITQKSLRNAMVVVMALGGSTNAVLDLIAIARSVGLELTLDDFQKVSDEVPFLADLKPSGKYVMKDLHKIGGTPAVMRYLLEQGLLDGDCITVTGRTVAKNVMFIPSLAKGQQIIRPIEDPIKSTGHIKILYGNIAPEGSVAKITGKEDIYFSGPALVFEGEDSMLAAISENPTSFKGKVVVIRGEGPKGGPGMPEMRASTSAIMGAGLGKTSEKSFRTKIESTWVNLRVMRISFETVIWPSLQDVALLTDGRLSGGSNGYVVGHICPEAQDGGPIGLVQNGDIITIDIPKRQMDVQLTDEELAERRKKWVAPQYKASSGVLYKYIKNVQPASRGCVTDE
ncbi:dihydroxy-acid dehydratase, chloroplastic-like isoform X2 [Tasmannia lanceolata]|uniref:dihydroxy-acid dehydratase, chloroplastic-like isoform X2 n=1 Tax=Tasmannia lanceolata TaxID=3420 RepID=UPI004064A1CB